MGVNATDPPHAWVQPQVWSDEGRWVATGNKLPMALAASRWNSFIQREGLRHKSPDPHPDFTCLMMYGLSAGTRWTACEGQAEAMAHWLQFTQRS